MDAIQTRALFNPYDEVPLRITAEAVRATRNAYVMAAAQAEREAAAAKSPAVTRTFTETAAMYRGLADELARAMDDPANVQVGDCLNNRRRAQLAEHDVALGRKPK